MVVTNYLWRELMPHIVDSIAPGGLLLWIMLVRWRQASGPRRRSLVPVAVVAVVLVAAYVVREALKTVMTSPPTL